MWSSTPTTVILSLTALLSAVSGLLLLWSRRRLLRRVEQAVHALRERVDALEALAQSTSDEPRPDPVHPVGPRRGRRFDAASISPRMPKLIAVPDLSAPPAPESDSAHALRLKYQEIWDQADSGLDAEAIARASGQPVGQIELILSLRRFDPESNAARASPS